jgi:outer membrane PBP1 activator LpoA protein
MFNASPRTRSYRPRRLGAALACALSLGWSALSAAQVPAASDATSPLGPQLPPEPPAMALVLPLESAGFGRAADAVRAGFLAAADAVNARPLVIAHGDGEVLAAFRKAADAGARVIVGPLVRDDLKAVAGAHLELPPTIALNQLDEGAALPETLYTLSLAIDGDARQLARAARDAGAATIAVIASDSALQRRFASAFIAEWILAGGGAPAMFRFDRAPDGLALLRRELGRTPVDAALLAVDATEVALAKPYLGTLPVYTSSQVNERPSREALHELEGVRFVDIPWLVDPDAPNLATLNRPEFPNASLDRLYALGIDAFRAAQAFAGGAPGKLEFDGATGRVALDASRQFVREARLMQYRSGRIAPATGP